MHLFDMAIAGWLGMWFSPHYAIAVKNLQEQDQEQEDENNDEG